MKNIIKNIIDKSKDTGGAIIVEATIVFPIMFFVLFFIIFIGNLYFEQAKIDSIVMENAVNGAKYVSNPSLFDLDHGFAVVTNPSNVKPEPYRYIFGSSGDGSISKIVDRVSKSTKEEVMDGSLIFFNNNNVNILGTENKNGKYAYYDGNPLHSTFIVQVNYELKFPIRFLMESQPTIIRLSSRAEVSVNDSPEFIRNVDMVVDLLEGTGLGEKIKGIFDKINGVIKKFAGK